MMDKQRLVTNFQHPGTAVILIVMLVALIAVVVIPAGSTLNAVFLVASSALFLACLSLITPDELGDFYRFSLWVVVFAFFLHSWYELLHSALYEDWTQYNYMVIVLITFISAVTDGVISWALFIIATLVRKGKWDWRKPWNLNATLFIIALALLGQTMGEVFALRTNRWSYGPLMPTIPVLGVGLTPLLQMPLMILITFWLAQQATCRIPRTKDQKIRA